MRFAIIILSMTLAGQLCANDLNIQEKKLYDFVENNNVGERDFWLQMETSYGWANVGLIFGYWDDYEACVELVEGLEVTQTFNNRRYRCIPANGD